MLIVAGLDLAIAMAVAQAAARTGAARIPGPRRPSAPAAPGGRRLWYLHPTAEQAWHAYRHVGEWVAAALASGASHVVFDLGRAAGLDFSSFAVALQRLRAAGIEVTITNAQPHVAVSLREIALLYGATLREGRRRPGRGPCMNAKARNSPNSPGQAFLRPRAGSATPAPSG